MMNYTILADSLRYPTAGLVSKLQHAMSDMPDCSEKTRIANFIKQVERLSLGSWEELYTRTLDLNPLVAPYIGYQIWGDEFRRGDFMAKLMREYREKGVDTEGELPDHLAPILRYLDTTSDPVPELLEIFGPSVKKMRDVLQKEEPENPYLHLVEALLENLDELEEIT